MSMNSFTQLVDLYFNSAYNIWGVLLGANTILAVLLLSKYVVLPLLKRLLLAFKI